LIYRTPIPYQSPSNPPQSPCDSRGREEPPQSLSRLSRRILDKLKHLVRQAKVPLVKLASILDKAPPAILAANLARKTDALDDLLGGIRRRARAAGDQVGAVVDHQLPGLEPDAAGHLADLGQPHDGEVDQGLERRVRAPALAGRPALAVRVRPDGGGVHVGIAVAGQRGRVGRAVFSAGREAVLRGWVEVVAAEALGGEDGGGAVVFGPGVLAAGDGGGLGLGQCGSEGQRQGAGEGGGRDEDAVQEDHVGCWEGWSSKWMFLV
jgi:hypothetical protein